MTKRKRDIFTVIEEVPNWWRAEENGLPLEGSEGNNHGLAAPEIPSVYGSGEVISQSATGASNREVHQTYVAGEVANEPTNWVQGHEGQPASLGVDTGARGPNRSPNHGTQSAAVGVNPGRGGPVQSTLTAEVDDWWRATRAPAANPPVGPELGMNETEDEVRYRSLNAFWALLLAACYEEI